MIGWYHLSHIMYTIISQGSRKIAWANTATKCYKNHLFFILGYFSTNAREVLVTLVYHVIRVILPISVCLLLYFELDVDTPSETKHVT